MYLNFSAFRDDFDCIDNYVALAYAIIIRCVRDYWLASVGLKKRPNSERLRVRKFDALRFFNSEWFSVLSMGVNPDKFIDELDEMIERGDTMPTNTYLVDYEWEELNDYDDC